MGVTATVTSSAASVVIVAGQGILHFGPVPANGQVTSMDTFAISVDRSVPFDFNYLKWSFLNPVANAGPDQTTTVGKTVTLNGSGSSNPSGIGLKVPIGAGSGLTDCCGCASRTASFVASTIEYYRDSRN